MAQTFQGIELYNKMRALKGKPNYIAAYLHLSRLQPVNKQPHYIRIAATTFDPILLKNATASVFTLRNRDIVFIGQNVDRRELQDIINKVRYLFSEDPLARIERDFVSIFSLTSMYQKFYAICGKIYEMEGGRDAEQQMQKRAESEGPSTIHRSFNGKMLSSIEAAVMKTDVTTLLRNKPICTVIEGAPPQVIFYEKKVILDEMISMMAPGIDVNSNKWFASYLMEIINERAIAIFGQGDSIEDEGTFSINLSIKTLLSQIFQDFDRSLGDYPRRNVVIEIALEDIVMNLNDFYAARDVLARMGYQTCISEIDLASLPYIDLSLFTADFVKLHWNRDVLKAKTQSVIDGLKLCLKSYSPASVIMGLSDDEEAVKFGQQMGMYLFQGKHIDSLMSAVVRKQGLSKQFAKSPDDFI